MPENTNRGELQGMKVVSLLFVLVLLSGCATTQVQITAEPECDRLVYNHRTGEPEPFICLGETFTWDGTDYVLLAEAIQPKSKAFIGFFDFTGDCEVDAAGIYLFTDGVYYLSGIVDPLEAYVIIERTETEMGVKILKQVDCLKN